MTTTIRWNSQPRLEWAKQHAGGQMVQVDGKDIHYLHFGDGPNLILIHGFYLDSFMWHRNFKALADHFSVYVPDLWGFGYSSRPETTYSYAFYAEQIKGFMEALGIDRAALMGQSMGGGTAMLFACQYPSQVEKLVLVDTAGLPAKIPLTSKVFQLPGVGEFLLNLNTLLIRKMNLVNFWIYRKDLVTEAFLQQATQFQRIHGTHEAMLAILRSGMFYTLAGRIPELAELGIPTLIVWGRQDRPIPLEVGERLHALLPDAEWVVFDEAGHLPNYEEADAFNRLAVTFLTTGELAGSDRQ